MPDPTLPFTGQDADGQREEASGHRVQPPGAWTQPRATNSGSAALHQPPLRDAEAASLQEAHFLPISQALP
jgi:hypothetical protein